MVKSLCEASCQGARILLDCYSLVTILIRCTLVRKRWQPETRAAVLETGIAYFQFSEHLFKSSVCR